MLRTKILRPSLTPELINRSQLIEDLNHNIYKPLTLVSAPAGFGKSMLISQWIEQNNIKAAWISIDEDCNDLRTFFSIIIEALQLIYPSKFNKIRELLNSVMVNISDSIVEELVNTLDNLEENVAIVLDDYHLIHSVEIHDFVNAYLQFPPENIHLVISTRRDPPLLINQMRLYNRIFEIRTQQLAFSEEEISEYILVNKHVKITHEISNQFLKKTEGWILGLKMLLFSYNDLEINNVSSSNLNQIKGFSEFLIKGIYKLLPESFIELLLTTSLLERFNGALIDYLIECNNYKGEYSGDTFIAEVIEKNLFIVSEDDQKEWFRFHHLFKELLQHQLLQKLKKREIDAYYLIFSKWFLDKADINTAIYYGIKAKEYEHVALIIEKHRYQKHLNVQWWVVMKWMKQLPESIVLERPALISSKILNCLERHQYSKFPALIGLLEKGLKKNSDPLIEGEVHYYKAFYDLYEIGNADSALVNLRIAQNLIQENELFIRRIAFTNAVAMQLKGQYKKAIDYLRQVIEKEPDSNILSVEYAIIIINLLTGKLKEAASAGETYCLSLKGKNHIYFEAWGHYFYANALFQMYEVEKSTIIFNRALEIHSMFHLRLVVDCKIGYLLSKYFSNEVFNEEILFEELEKTAEDAGLIHLAHSCRARVNVFLGNLEEAGNWAKSCREEFHVKNTFWLIEVPAVTKVRVYLALNDSDKIKWCLDHLSEYHDKLLSINNQYHMIDILLLQATGYYKLNKPDDATVFLKEALEIGESTGFIRPFIEAGVQLKEMLINTKINNNLNKFINKILERIDSTYSTNKFDSRAITRKSVKSNDLKLSKRELEIIVEVSNGYRNQEIADKLYISLETVKSHVKNSMRKLNAKNRMELVRKVQAHSLIEN